MRVVTCAPLNTAVSALGFGCASLGSRVSAYDGARALARAYDLGVTWFDVAPSYGDGHAETLLGDFLVGRRDKVVICTKSGIARPRPSLWKATARTMLQPLVRVAPRIREMLAPFRAIENREPITGKIITTSLRESMRELRTDYIDVLALHEPSLEDCLRDDVIMALERAKAAGEVRALAIAGTADVARAALSRSTLFTFVQVSDSPFQRHLDALRPIAQAFFVTHGVFSTGAARQLLSAVGGSSLLRQQLAEQGYDPSSQSGEILLDWAFASNTDGVVLTSMFGRDHTDANCERACRPARSQLRTHLSWPIDCRVELG